MKLKTLTTSPISEDAEQLEAKHCSHIYICYVTQFPLLSVCPNHKNKCACKDSHSVTAVSKQSKATQIAVTTKTAHRIYCLTLCIGTLVFRA